MSLALTAVGAVPADRLDRPLHPLPRRRVGRVHRERGRLESVKDDLLLDPEQHVVAGLLAAVVVPQPEVVVEAQLFDLARFEERDRLGGRLHPDPAGRGFAAVVEPDLHRVGVVSG